MKRNFKNFLKVFVLVLVLFAFVFSLTACNGTDQPVSPNGGDVDPDDPGTNPGTDPGTNPSGDTDDKPIDVSKIKFFGSVVTYDGKEHSIEINKASIPEGVTVEYEGNGKTEVGSYQVKATLKDKNGNVLKELTAILTINKIKRNVSKVEFKDTTFEWEYNKSYELVAKNIPEGVSAVYENNTLSNIGETLATVKLYDDFDNELLATLTATLKVKYRVVHDEDAFASHEYVADGSTFTLTLADSVASNYTNVTYTNNSASTQGTYLASALVTTSDNDMFEYHAVLNIANPRNEEFASYVDEMFVYFLSGDQSTLNIFMIDYEAYGFEHQDATWYSYEQYSEEDRASDLEELAELKADLAKFNRDELNSYQKVDYDKIKSEIDYLDFMINNPEFILMRQTYVDQYGGYAGDIPTTMEAYQIRTKQDIEDIISYIDSIKDAFPTYVTYALDRAEAGYPLSNFTISNMVDYLEGVTKRNAKDDDEDKDAPYYLIAILENKIKDSKEKLNLTDDEVNAYLGRLDTAFVGFLQAHNDLADELKAKCMNLGNESNQYYLASYGEKGKQLYEILLRNRLGITISMEDYIAFLDETLIKYSTAYSGVSGANSSIINGEVKVLNSDDPQDIIAFLKEFAKTIVPDLATTPQIDVAYMDKTVTANTTTLAYYMKSALDSTENEYIHLNGDALGKDYLETIKTLAHEGYPGHLYAYVSTKENANLSNFVRVSTNTGHGEGWAKYVECALCDYLGELKKGEWKPSLQRSKYWDLYVYNIYTRIDVGIHYEGWTASDVYRFFRNQNLAVDEDGAKEIMQDLVEMPGQYAAYGYGQSLFYELHEEAKSLLGDTYNEVEFNAMLLSHGWIDLHDLVELYDNYMSQKCFLLGVEFNGFDE